MISQLIAIRETIDGGTQVLKRIIVSAIICLPASIASARSISAYSFKRLKSFWNKCKRSNDEFNVDSLELEQSINDRTLAMGYNIIPQYWEIQIVNYFFGFVLSCFAIGTQSLYPILGLGSIFVFTNVLPTICMKDFYESMCDQLTFRFKFYLGNIDAQNHLGNTALHMAYFRKDLDYAQLLLDKGANDSIEAFSSVENYAFFGNFYITPRMLASRLNRELFEHENKINSEVQTDNTNELSIHNHLIELEVPHLSNDTLGQELSQTLLFKNGHATPIIHAPLQHPLPQSRPQSQQEKPEKLTSSLMLGAN